MPTADQQIVVWREEYLANLNNWSEQLDSAKQHFANVIHDSWAKTAYVARVSQFDPTQMLMCPPHSSLNMAPNQQHRGDYGTGIFEGSSAEPVVDSMGKIVGLNVVLHEPRMARFARSLVNRNYNLATSLERFAQSALDIVAVHGLEVVTADDGSPTRAYIRPAAGPGVGPWGVSFKPGYFIEASNIVFRWGHYFPEVDRLYYQSGARVVTTGARRMFPITGKHASNYGAAAVDGNLARAMNYDELVYLAPYGIKDDELDYAVNDFDQLVRYGVLADGPGEEVFGISADGETIIYPPMRVNRLGGTVLDYVINHMLPALGLRSEEGDITLQDLREGRVVGLAFAGNAARIAPIGSIDLVKPVGEAQGEKVETVVDFGIHPTIGRIRDQWEGELRGSLIPSHPSLLTPVDLQWGSEFRAYLDDYWAKIGFKSIA